MKQGFGLCRKHWTCKWTNEPWLWTFRTSTHDDNLSQSTTKKSLHSSTFSNKLSGVWYINKLWALPFTEKQSIRTRTFNETQLERNAVSFNTRDYHRISKIDTLTRWLNKIHEMFIPKTRSMRMVPSMGPGPPRISCWTKIDSRTVLKLQAPDILIVYREVKIHCHEAIGYFTWYFALKNLNFSANN